MTEGDAWEELSEVAREMSTSSGVKETLEAAVDGALTLIDGLESVGISMVYKSGSIETMASSDDRSSRGDELQYELGQGPCLQSIGQEETVHSRDLATEDRWPKWSHRVAEELGVRSMLCFQLFVTHDSIGALNLYSTTVDAFDDEDRDIALALAAHIAVALSAAKELDELHSAIATRTIIGQAQGMLMQRYELNPSQAFDVLSRASQHSNRRLRTVAENLVQNGIKPEYLT